MSIKSRLTKLSKRVQPPKIKYPSIHEMYSNTDWESWMRAKNPESEALELAISNTKQLSDMY